MRRGWLEVMFKTTTDLSTWGPREHGTNALATDLDLRPLKNTTIPLLRTPFHADVFRSYSWSTNVCGCKEWLLFPPGQEDYLRDRLGNLPFDVTGTDLEDKTRYPNASKVCEPIRVIQNAGETIFIPRLECIHFPCSMMLQFCCYNNSGWYHQVKNLEDTISINHNWTNTFGILFVWRHLQNELKLVLQNCGYHGNSSTLHWCLL